eukprot:GFUD01101462.1.p2 GENE.GFUD01101462.1~~GFUD01101462.1.p2  ORF type:complete len:101 (-),score=28.13 GFUD01101462.1:53-355(-)
MSLVVSLLVSNTKSSMLLVLEMVVMLRLEIVVMLRLEMVLMLVMEMMLMIGFQSDQIPTNLKCYLHCVVHVDVVITTQFKHDVLPAEAADIDVYIDQIVD